MIVTGGNTGPLAQVATKTDAAKQSAQRAACVSEFEDCRDRHRLTDGRQLYDRGIEAAACREFANLGQQILAKRPTNRVRHPAHKLGVDVDFAHVVDNDRDTAPLSLGEHLFQKRGFAGAHLVTHFTIVVGFDG